MHRGLRSVTEVAYHFFLPAFSPVWGVRCTLQYFNVSFCSIIFSFNVECWMLTWRGAQAFLESRCKDMPISRYHQISACDKARFSARFQSKPVKNPNSPFCAPQLILFQKRKHRVKEKKIQHLIQYSVIQFFFKGLLFTPLKSKVYILSIYLYILINIYII